MAVVVGEGVVELTAELKGFRDSIEKQTDTALKKTESEFEDSGDKSGKKFGKGAAIAIGAAMGGVAVAALAGLGEALDREASSANLAASIGLGPEEAAQAGKLAGDLYSDNFGESFDQVNDAIAAVTQAGLSAFDAPQAEIEGLTAKALTLADVFDTDVSDAVTSAGILMETGLAGNGERAFDLITSLFQSLSPVMRQPVLDAVNEYGVFFSQLGIDGENALSALADASSGGEIAIDKVGDAFKELTIRAVDGSTSTADALDSLGLNAGEIGPKIAAGGDEARSALDAILISLGKMDDKVLQTQAGVALFGAPFEDLGTEALPILNNIRGELEGVEGAAQKVVDTVGSTDAAKLETFKRQIETNVTNVMSKATDIITKLPGPLQTAVGTMIGLGPVLSPLAAIIGPMIPLMFGLGGATTAASGGFKLLSVSTLTAVAPFVLIGAAVAALVFVFVKNFDTIKEVAGSVWHFLQDVWDNITEIFISAKNTVIDFVTQWGILFLGPIGVVIKFKDEIFGAFESIVSFVAGLPGRIADAASGLFDGIKDAFRGAINFIIEGWNSISFKLPSFGGLKIAGRTVIPGFEGPTLALPKITPLAAGGIAYGPLLAMIGERQPEVVAPLDKLEGIIRNAVGTGGPTIQVNVTGVGLDEIADTVARRVSMTLGMAAGL